MSHHSSWQLLDKTGEKASVKVHHGALTAVNLPGFLTDFGTMKTAIDNITMGTLSKEKIVMDDTNLSQVLPTSNFAQRENRLLVVYSGNTSNKKYTLTIPTADLGVVTFVPGGGDAIDLTTTEIAAFKTAFEAFARTPDDDTETVTIVEMRAIGRNV